MVIWKTEDYYAICQTSNQDIKNADENIAVIKENPDQL